MEHQSLADVRQKAAIQHVIPLSRTDRLNRWADRLEASTERRLRTLYQTEFTSRHRLPKLRADNSPISVAVADPVLRAAGLEDDTYGTARRFFGLSDHELHYVTCYCQLGDTVDARIVARRVRNVAKWDGKSLWSRLWNTGR